MAIGGGGGRPAMEGGGGEYVEKTMGNFSGLALSSVIFFSRGLASTGIQKPWREYSRVGAEMEILARELAFRGYPVAG
jgi:hypothetical protein